MMPCDEPKPPMKRGGAQSHPVFRDHVHGNALPTHSGRPASARRRCRRSGKSRAASGRFIQSARRSRRGRLTNLPKRHGSSRDRRYRRRRALAGRPGCRVESEAPTHVIPEPASARPLSSADGGFGSSHGIVFAGPAASRPPSPCRPPSNGVAAPCRARSLQRGCAPGLRPPPPRRPYSLLVPDPKTPEIGSTPRLIPAASAAPARRTSVPSPAGRHRQSTPRFNP